MRSGSARSGEKWRHGCASRESMSEGRFGSLKGGRLLLWGFLLLLSLLFLGRWGAIVYTDLLWYSSEGALRVYLTQLSWEWGVRIAVGLAAGLVSWMSLQAMAYSFQGLQIRRRFGNLVIQEQLPEHYLRWGVRFSVLFFAFWFALALPRGTGLRGMFLVMAEEWGELDPILGRDLGFYLFTLPALRSLLDLLLILTSLLTLLAISGYFVTGRLVWSSGKVHIPFRGPRIHLGLLAGGLALLMAVRFHFTGYALLFAGSSGVQEIFGYADHQAKLPVYRLFTLLAIASAPFLFWAVRSGKTIVAAAAFSGLVLGGGITTQVVPLTVQRFRVQPNELGRETPYIVDAIRMTRIGFGLDGISRMTLPFERSSPPDLQETLTRMRRLPIWTESTLLTSFRQTEAGFQYYNFEQVALDRYPVREDGAETQIAVAVREVDPSGIPDPNPGWQNLHMRERYIVGMGAVAAEATRRTPEGRVPILLPSLASELRSGGLTPTGLTLERPSIYIGSRFQSYAIIDPRQGEFLSPEGTSGVPGEDFPRGIPMGSMVRKLMLALRFQDPNLLLASEIDSNSRLVIRRSVEERVRALAPFLLLPEAPYPVISEGRVIWILEGFTLSRSLPLSRPHRVGNGIEANYLRNSVKATVDAVTGETRLYVSDPSDPIIRVLRKGFPTLFRDLDEMPVPLQRHLRYSRAYLDAQIGVLSRYHMEDPSVFHGQQDIWARAIELSVGGEPIPYRPEYALLTIPGEDDPTFTLSALFVPQGRQTLAAFLIARWNAGEGGELRLWDLPQDDPFQGPRQIDAMVEQDPRIAEQFSLWRQGGSQVWTGHLHLVTVGSRLFYMEPVFLAADIDAIPEIPRIIVSDGARVAMEPTLEGALAALLGGSLVDALAESESGRPSSEALDILNRAEESLRAGEWQTFGRYLEELRRVLERSVGEVTP